MLRPASEEIASVAHVLREDRLDRSYDRGTLRRVAEALREGAGVSVFWFVRDIVGVALHSEDLYLV